MLQVSKIISLFVVLSFTSACSLLGVRSEEQPPYKVLKQEESNEIRLYSSYIVAETTVVGTYKEAQKEGFRRLAGFIFGDNLTKKELETIKKSQKVSEKIAMTAPVFLQGKEQNTWVMTFTMPSKYTMNTLPQPKDKRVKIKVIPEKKYAVYKYTGFWNEKKNNKLGLKLQEWTNKQNYEIQSTLIFAGYNPPWTLPFLRRNEVMFEVK